MEFIEQIKNDVTIVTVKARQIIGVDMAYKLRAKISSCVEKADQVKVILNLGDVEIIDSTVFALIIFSNASVLRRGGRFGLLNPKKNVKDLIDIAKLHNVLLCFDNEGDAIAKLSA